MDRKRHFDIHFVGLKNSIHFFEYEIQPSFFEMYDKSPIQLGNLTIKLNFDKKDSFFILNFQVDGIINLPCDRCNDPFDYELLCDFQVIIKFDEVEDNKAVEDDVVYISRNDSEINIADLIYEYIIINIPIQVFHPNNSEGISTCNPVILEKLKTNPSIIEETEIDPRWASLTKLKK